MTYAFFTTGAILALIGVKGGYDGAATDPCQIPAILAEPARTGEPVRETHEGVFADGTTV